MKTKTKTIYMLIAILTVVLPSSFAISGVTEINLENGAEHINIQQPTE